MPLSTIFRLSRGENHQPTASNWLSLSHNVVSSTHRLSGIPTHNVRGDCIGSYQSNYHTITTMTALSIKEGKNYLQTS